VPAFDREPGKRHDTPGRYGSMSRTGPADQVGVTGADDASRERSDPHRTGRDGPCAGDVRTGRRPAVCRTG
jgi:hypothetical protein